MIYLLLGVWGTIGIISALIVLDAIDF